MPPSLLVVSSETPDQQDARRRRSGMASHETYAETLREIAPECTLTHHCCVAGPILTPTRIADHDAVVFAGSPIQMHEATEEVRRAARFMQSVFEVGRPAFGSCAGLQIAAVAAGGTVVPCASEMNAGFTRGVVRSPSGRDHPLLRERPGAWDAPTMHSARVDRLPVGGKSLARSRDVPVEAAEIRSGSGVFWGVQYHPELALWEIAHALKAQAGTLVDQGLARGEGDIGRYADALEDLEADPERRDLAWQLGLDAEVIDMGYRRREIRNFLAHLAEMG